MPADRLKQLEERTRYDAGQVEGRVFERWEEAGIFSPDPDGDASENYSIAVPPPNVTGALHMGHALNGRSRTCSSASTGCRACARSGSSAPITRASRRRSRSRSSSRARAPRAPSVGREAFTERVWQWREEYGGTILEQFRRLGASLDYADERFTMDEAYVRAVLHVFVALYEKGYVYRDSYMVNWDPGLRSAISDLEVEQRTVEDTLYKFDYPLEGGSGSLTIATVRPETILADTAIAVHPDDERYTRLIGEHAILPLVGRRLPIIADEYVDPEFGTGALKITPATRPERLRDRARARPGGDQRDRRGRAHDRGGAGERFEGLHVDEARNAVVAALREEGLVSGTQPFVHEVPHSHRSGPADRAADLAPVVLRHDPPRRAGDRRGEGRLAALPSGAPAPPGVSATGSRTSGPGASRGSSGGAISSPSGTAARRRTSASSRRRAEGWERDPDVLDTWFSSALWPFATLGWPEETPKLRAFYPTDVLSTARDILFLWVARMVMMGVEFTGELPFRDVVVHSVIQAPDGRRMSKSLGTGIDPIDLIDTYGADALRFGLLAMSSGQDVRFNEDRVKQGADLANKLWNASRLVLLRGRGRRGGAARATPSRTAGSSRGSSA